MSDLVCVRCGSTEDVIEIRRTHGVMFQYQGRKEPHCAKCRDYHRPRWTYAHEKDRIEQRRKKAKARREARKAAR